LRPGWHACCSKAVRLSFLPTNILVLSSCSLPQRYILSGTHSMLTSF
jgi:hypothetical protein